MTVCAEQYALLCLGAHSAKATTVASLAQVELLLRGIAVMELERGGMLRKAACRTLSTSLFDEQALDGPAPLRHSGDVALGAPESALGAREERGMSMSRTTKVGLAKTGPLGCFAFPTTHHPIRLQTQLSNPMTHGRVTDAQLLCNRPDRHTPFDEVAQTFHVDVAFRRVPRLANSRQPVLLHPIAHGRRMAADQLADRFQPTSLLPGSSRETAFPCRNPDNRRRQKHAVISTVSRPARRGRCARPGWHARG
jgi:hypothetical protein